MYIVYQGQYQLFVLLEEVVPGTEGGGAEGEAVGGAEGEAVGGTEGPTVGNKFTVGGITGGLDPTPGASAPNQPPPENWVGDRSRLRYRSD